MDDYQISWVAHEYERSEHSVDWYWTLGIVTISLVVAFVIIGNILLSIILLLGVATIFIHERRPSREITYELSKNGVRADEVLYPWQSLESFWILKGPAKKGRARMSKLLLTSKKSFMPHIVLPLEESVVDEVHEAMSNMLAEEEQVEPFVDRFTRKLGF